MSIERFDKIIKDHPLLFRYCTYFECDTGWDEIIEDLANKLEPLIEAFNIENPEDSQDVYPCASQVKEKYGGLRFYMTIQSDEMSDLIQEAEKKSIKTCENCGKPGKIRGKEWVFTRCDECWEVLRKNRWPQNSSST